MKIKISKNYKYNLFKLKLIKIILKNNKTIGSFINNLEQVELDFKKVLQIIYEYHINDKRILFLGAPVESQRNFKKILKKTNHYIIPNFIWVNGLLSNKTSIYRSLKLKRLKSIKKHIPNNNNINLLLKIPKKPDLIVIFKKSLDKNAINEIYKLRIPVLFFDFKFTSEVSKNFLKIDKLTIDIFFTVVYKILKKTKNIK